jgi:predicted TIM-barrel fold metal-dependent hydrolase
MRERASMAPITVVSIDGHASVPEELWSEYLDRSFHDWLPALSEENRLYQTAMEVLRGLTLGADAQEVFDTAGVYAAGQWTGLWDRDVRLAEMDREGIASEVVYYGDPHQSDLFHNVMNGTYPHDVVDAGARAYNRWAHDTFGPAGERLLLSGALGSCTDVETVVAELVWLADHGFVASYAPGFCGVPGLPPLHAEVWDPVWATYADRGLVPVIHGGYGLDQGLAFQSIDESFRRVDAIGGSEHDLVRELTSGLFNEGFFNDLRCRQAMWHLMLGGVFDRHPDLKLMLTEVRADWIPATLSHLDDVFEANRRDLPALRRPSEYWQERCLAGVSFMHEAEVEIRHDIGLDQLAFGRDYPHIEGTWPNTGDFWKLIFEDVPEADLRKVLGENAVRFFGLDPEPLDRIAARIGPSYDDIAHPDLHVAPALVEHLAGRCGVLKPAEGASRLAEVDAVLRGDPLLSH